MTSYTKNVYPLILECSNTEFMYIRVKYFITKFIQISFFWTLIFYGLLFLVSLVFSIFYTDTLLSLVGTINTVIYIKIIGTNIFVCFKIFTSWFFILVQIRQTFSLEGTWDSLSLLIFVLTVFINFIYFCLSLFLSLR